MTDQPDRLWMSAQMGDEGRGSFQGMGRVEPGERFTVSANGMLVEVIVTQLEYVAGSTGLWTAIDLMTYKIRHQIPDGLDSTSSPW